jgi:hypothetical protein
MSKGRKRTGANEPVVLDERRGMMAQKATEVRRHLAEIEADQAALRSRQEELERYLLAAPAASWAEAVEKVRYLLTLLAATYEGRDPRRRKIIAAVMDDLTRLLKDTDGGAVSPPEADLVARPTGSPGPGAEGGPETETEKSERLLAGDADRAASRKATEASRGKRQRGGGMSAQGPPRPRR